MKRTLFARYQAPLAAATLAAGAMLLGGCTSKMTSAALEGKPLPRGGEAIDASVWEAARTAPENARVGSRSHFYSPLTLIKHKRWFSVDSTRTQAAASRMSYYGLGVRYLNLPLESSYSHHMYREGTAEPVGSVKRGLHPLWSWAKTTGELSPDFEVKAGGVPLLYDWANERADEWYLEESQNDLAGLHRHQQFWRTLWNIGPANHKFKDSQAMPDGSGSYEGEERYFTPLMLGGIGVLLYTHYRRDASDPTSESFERGSGPLFGHALYYHGERNTWAATRSEAEAPIRHQRYKTILGGILWYDSLDQAAEKRTRSTGPLFALFGKGERDGRKVTYIFRIPIKGKAVDAAE